jgi:hypothetical protein
MSSIRDLIDSARPLDENNNMVSFARSLYRIADSKFDAEHKGVALAALFDLAVSALYAGKISSNGWLYCRDRDTADAEPKLFYPFVNACPRCSLRGVFHFVPSKKPGSAAIGQATSLILTTFLDEHARSRSDGACQVMQLGGTGAVDAIAVEGNKVCLFEIKSAPLVTFPIEANTKIMITTDDFGNEQKPLHFEVTLPPTYVDDLNFIISEDLKVPIGRQTSSDNWPCDVLEEYLSYGDNLNQYVANWNVTYQRYSGQIPKEKTYWLTNGCGQPPRSDGWPVRRNGSGYESISDGKSSVGLDRTDDIKKGIYQVLKIGTHYKEFANDSDYEVFTSLTSNIHAVKHHDDYLKEFEDMMWTIDSKDRSYVVNRDKGVTSIKTAGLYNLYDGLITFTGSHYRSEWVKERFGF